MFNLRNRNITTARAIAPSMSSTFTVNEIASMAGLGTLIHVDAHDELMTEGTSADFVYFLVDGSATVTRDGQTIAVLNPGDMVGERAFLLGEPRNATVTALESLKVLQFDEKQFAWLRLESPKVRAIGEAMVSSRS